MAFDIPRVCQCDDTSCASANYAMVANSLGLDLSLRDILEITHGTLGMAEFWTWCLSQNIEIKCISKNDYRAWADGGLDEWRRGTPEWAARFFLERSIDGARDTAAKFAKIFENKNFEFQNRPPAVDDIRKLFDAGYSVEIMGDGWMMYGDAPEMQLLHRVFITNVDGDDVYFHDPATDGEANHKASMGDIMSALSVDGAEVVGYRKL